MKELAVVDYSTKAFSNRVIILDLHPLMNELHAAHPNVPLRKVCDFITLVGNESIASGKRFSYTVHHQPFTKHDSERVTHELIDRLAQLFASLFKLTEVFRYFIFQVIHRKGQYPRVALVDARSDKAIKNLSHLSF